MQNIHVESFLRFFRLLNVFEKKEALVHCGIVNEYLRYWEALAYILNENSMKECLKAFLFIFLSAPLVYFSLDYPVFTFSTLAMLT